jgi:hypothetical protein
MLNEAWKKLLANLLSVKVGFLLFMCVMFVMSYITFNQLMIVAAPVLALRFAGQETVAYWRAKNGKSD